MNASKSFKNKDELQTFMDNDLEWMYNRIFTAITEAMRLGYDEAQILDAKIEEDFSTFTITSPAEDWVNSLTLCITWFEKNEEYEKCSTILELIDRIKTEYDWLHGSEQTDIQ